jgi:hypothetical protein
VRNSSFGQREHEVEAERLTRLAEQQERGIVDLRPDVAER